MATKSVAPTPNAVHLLRRTLRPYGTGNLVVTLSLWDTGNEHPQGGNWLTYRLYSSMPGSGKRTEIVFEGTTAPAMDPDDVAVRLIDRLTRRPGDEGTEEEAWTPTQLDWVLHHGRAVREVAVNRLAWSIPTAQQLRAGFDVVYAKRVDPRAALRHQYSSGVVMAAARTKTEAKTAFARAVGGQLSSLPVFRVGVNSRQVYALYPHGADWVLQVVDPTRPQAPLGESVRFQAGTVAEAEALLTKTMGTREGKAPISVPPPAGPRVATPPPPQPKKRPKARAWQPTMSVRPPS